MKIKGTEIVSKEVEIEVSADTLIKSMYNLVGLRGDNEYGLGRKNKNDDYEYLCSFVDISRHGSPCYEVSQIFSREQTECYKALIAFEDNYKLFKKG